MCVNMSHTNRILPIYATRKKNLPSSPKTSPPTPVQCGCLGVKTNNSLSNNMENKYKNIE